MTTPTPTQPTITTNLQPEGMSSASTLMSKKDRKKLKKLRKRVVHLQNEGEQSGLLSFSQHEEYQALVKAQPIFDSNNDGASFSTTKSDPKEKTTSTTTLDEYERLHAMVPHSSIVYPSSYCPLACPTINFRKKALGIKKVEGVHHRDLLAWLLQQQIDGKRKTYDSSISSPLSKKRHRDDIGGNIDSESIISIPHWASIHNPVTCEQVVVLEIHVPHDKIDSYREFLESCEVRSDTLKIKSRNIHPHTQIGIETKWFQGYIPKSMSESLLYFSNIKKDKKKTIGKNTDQQSIILSKKDLIERLATMVLSSEEMAGQGYPTMLSSFQDEMMKFIDSKVNYADFRKEKFESIDNISLEMAGKFTERFGIRLQNQLEKDKTSYIGTLRYPTIVNHIDNKTTDNGLADGDESPIRVLGIDCEMVMTTVGSELARVTLIQFDQYIGSKDSADTTVLLDCLVRPRNRIVDYLTMYSGITPDLLEPISTRIEQVQYAMASYLTSRDILVGHSLENDLRALHYIHPRVVDTSMIFRPTDKNKRFKFSLRHLSGVLLKRKIQNGSHCSEEDAQAALDIAFLKAFMGDKLRVPGCGDDNRLSLLQKKFMTKNTAVFIGPNPWLEAHITNNPNGAHALSYDSPNDCKKAMLSWITGRRRAQLVWSKIVLKSDSKITSSLDTSLETFKSLVTDIVEKLHSNCVLMVAVQGELQKAQDMFKQRRACQDPRSSIEWSSDKEEGWKKLLESTRAGHVHWFSAATNNNT